MEGFKQLDLCLTLAQELRTYVNSTKVFRALSLAELLPKELIGDGILLDTTKITIDISASSYSADEFQKILFEKYHIQVEKSTFNTITLLVTIGTTRSKVSRLHDALLRMAKASGPPHKHPKISPIAPFTKLKYLPRDAFYCMGELMRLADDSGELNVSIIDRVCADQVVPYPPGIPCLVPGQIVSREIVGYLLSLRKYKVVVHGIDEGDSDIDFSIRVLTLQEESKLVAF
jgi:arginine decarboxylase